MSAVLTPNSTALSARGLRVYYDSRAGLVRAVDGVDLDLHRGKTLGLVGESGCGKSTLGRGLLGLLPEGAAADGSVRVADTEVLSLAPKALRALRGPVLGMVFQEPMTRLNPLLTVCGHFLEVLRRHRPELSKAEAAKRALSTLGAMGIPASRFEHYPHEFSGGMRQRIMIALALVLEPQVLIADEPTTALDVLVEAQILQILTDIRRNFDTAILLITHALGIVAETCDDVAVMYAGEIVETGNAREVFARPKHPYTRELLASTISLKSTTLRTIPGEPPNLIAPPHGCRFASRCPEVMPVCTTEEPSLVRTGSGEALCWLHADRSQTPTAGDPA
ncbi:MAG: ABC transporter ATP-binding protein [bacterium]|jgi:oligopeptide/dipeptide ABC transporter ATP-binding protein|nr:ABC transporter ATP-binding protein [bacterium]